MSSRTFCPASARSCQTVQDTRATTCSAVSSCTFFQTQEGDTSTSQCSSCINNNDNNNNSSSFDNKIGESIDEAEDNDDDSDVDGDDARHMLGQPAPLQLRSAFCILAAIQQAYCDGSLSIGLCNNE